MKIDKIFIISLEERKEDRLMPLLFKLHELGFENYTVCRAIKNKNGALGLIETIKKLFTECVEQGLENILVFEDDVSFITDNIKDKINVCLSQAPEDFDCIYLGCNLWQNVVFNYSPNLIQLYDAYGLQSVIYSRKAMAKIIEAIDNMKAFVPLDVLIQNRLMAHAKCFCSYPALTSQIVSYSNIQNKVQDWGKVLHDRFIEKTKHLA